MSDSDNKKEEEVPSLTAEEIELLLQHEELTPELQDLIEQYQQATSSLQDPKPESEEEKEDSSIGSKCAIIFAFEQYEMLLLPAIILSYSATKAEAQVLVLTPVTTDSIPCTQYFDQQKECPAESLCPHSHGNTVPTEYILPFEALEIDTKLDYLQYGKKVWCKKEGDDLWKLGNIIDQLHGPRWRVRLKKREARQPKRNILNVDADHIMPFKSLGDDNSYDDENEEWSESDRESVDDYKPNKDDIIIDKSNRLYDQSWGSWQVHTTGFAAKMMKKMGYVEGKGLGMDGEGRMDPIEAQPYSNQQSSNINSRPGLGLKHEKKKKKTASKKKEQAPPPLPKEELDMFGLMNTLLGDKDEKQSPTPSNIPTKVNNGTRQEMNQTISKLQSQLDKAQNEYLRATEAFRRNRGSTVENQFLAKLKSATLHLDTLKKQMDQLQRQVKQTKEKKDMYTF